MLLGNRLGCETSRPHVEQETVTEQGVRCTTVVTPDGTLTNEWRQDEATNTWHPVKFSIGSARELAAWRWLYRDVTHTVSPEAAADHAARQEKIVDKDSVSTCGVGPSPLMEMIQHEAGPINTIYLMQDEPELFAEVMGLMHESRMDHLRAVAPHLRADTFWFTENTSTTLISPQMFRDICMPQLKAYADLMNAHGPITVHHMCGKLNALLEMIDALPAHANEAYTTPTVGDATLAEGRTRMPSKALIGGTNAALLLQPVETIVERVEADLRNCPDRRGIFLTSAGVLPAAVSFEKARDLVSRLKALPVM
jgi:hypothetical protein